MKTLFNNKKRLSFIFSLLAFIILAQALVIGRLYKIKDEKTYRVNLVKINTEKDSINHLKMHDDLLLMDRTVQSLHNFLSSKNITDARIETLRQDSLSKGVYLAKQANRYSQYLVDLQEKLMQVPLGLPSDGYISSGFGNRKNPIPVPRKPVETPAATVPAPAAPQIIEEKDSLGNVIKRTVVPAQAIADASQKAPLERNNPPAEADQMQFHKGIDVAVAYGSDVRCAAEGTVIFAGAKGGYGNCVIVSHGNGLATLYGHLSEILVKANEYVKVNQVIAKTGNSGRSTGPHLHYEVHKNNTPVNPKLFLNF